MKKNLVRAAAAAVALGFVGIAQAVPVYFDFTGTLTGFSGPPPDGFVVGGAISGGFNFETDRLFETPPVSVGAGTQYTFVDWQPTGLTDPFAWLNFGGRSLAWPNYESNYNLINFLESCRVPEDVVPGSIVSLPLYDLIGVHSETTSSCVAGVCTTIEDRQLGFSVDSVSRGEGPRPVPEPGTLGLLGVALAGMLFLRRRPSLLQR